MGLYAAWGDGYDVLTTSNCLGWFVIAPMFSKIGHPIAGLFTLVRM